MNPNDVRKTEQIRLSWNVARTDFPTNSSVRSRVYTSDSAGKVSDVPVMQEVVKFDLVGSGMSTPVIMEEGKTVWLF